MTSVFLPMPEIMPTTAATAVAGGTLTADASDRFGRMLDMVLGESDTLGESDMAAQSLPAQDLTDLSGFIYVAAPLTAAPEPQTNRLTDEQALPLTPPPVNPVEIRASGDAPVATDRSENPPFAYGLIDAEMAKPLSLPVNPPENPPANPTVNSPAPEAIKTPEIVTAAARTAVTRPEPAPVPAPIPAASPASVVTQTTLSPRTAAMSEAAPTNIPVQTTARPITPDAPEITPDAGVSSQPPPPVIPQTAQGHTAPVDINAPRQAQLSAPLPATHQALKAQMPVAVDAPLKSQSFDNTQTAPATSPVASAAPPETRLNMSYSGLAAAPTEALAANRDKTVTLTAATASTALPETEMTQAPASHAPVAPATASVMTETTPAPANLALPVKTQSDLPLTQTIMAGDPALAPTETTTETPHKPAVQPEAQTGAKTDAASRPLLPAGAEPLTRTAMPVQAEPAPEVASAPVVKPDTAAADPAPLQLQPVVPATPPVADAAAKAPLQPVLTPVVSAPPAPPHSNLSAHTVENIAALSALITRKLSGKTTQFDMQLKPADQGRVDVRLEINGDGKLSAHLSFDSPVSESEFRGRQDDLRRQLEQAGFQLEDGALSFSSRERRSREGERHPLSADAFDADTADTDVRTPPPTAGGRPYAGAPVDGLYSSGQSLSLSLLV